MTGSAETSLLEQLAALEAKLSTVQVGQAMLSSIAEEMHEQIGALPVRACKSWQSAAAGRYTHQLDALYTSVSGAVAAVAASAELVSNDRWRISQEIEQARVLSAFQTLGITGG